MTDNDQAREALLKLVEQYGILRYRMGCSSPKTAGGLYAEGEAVLDQIQKALRAPLQHEAIPVPSILHKTPVLTGMTFLTDVIINGVPIPAGTKVDFAVPAASASTDKG